MADFFRISGEVVDWPSKARMAEILRASGLAITVGTYSIRINDCEHFVFQEYGGDLGEPAIDADAESLEQMLIDAGRVSQALAAADVRHRFAIYDEADEMVRYLHHRWLPPS
jgi:hypothetical protein